MKALIVYAHPNPQSFNKAILDTVVHTLEDAGAEYQVSDLYAMNWNPVMDAGDFENIISGSVADDVRAEQSKVAWADTLIFVYPVWWVEQPGILKGWLDRVFTHGFAYRSMEWGVEGLLRGKKALVITTSGADEATMAQTGAIEAIKTCMLKGTLGFTGIAESRYKNFFAVPLVSDEDRREMLEEVRHIVQYVKGLGKAA